MLLSILIPGKNDNYYNSGQKLYLNLLKTISNISLREANDIEIVLCDWGSDIKITDQYNLKTSNNFRCVYVPPDIAKKYNKGENYSIVHPINTAFKNSRGKYVIFWDSDCYVQYEDFVKLYDFVLQKQNTNDNFFYWGSRYHIPYNFYENIFSIQELDSKLKDTNINNFFHDKINAGNFLGCSISLLMDRYMWEDSTGFWEELTLWGWQDIEFHQRLCQRYAFGGDLEDRGINFFHLNHKEESRNEIIATRKNNGHSNASYFQVNGDTWGLNNELLEIY